jgi:hypothetical protein
MTEPLRHRPSRRTIVWICGGLVVLLAAGITTALLLPRTAETATTAAPTPGTSVPTSTGTSIGASTGTSPGSPTAAPGDSVESPAAAAPEDGDVATGSPTIDAFTVDTPSVVCENERSTVPLTFSWSSTGGQSARLGVGTTDAQQQSSVEVPVVSAGFAEVAFDCRDLEQVYALTVSDGVTSTSANVYVSRELP